MKNLLFTFLSLFILSQAFAEQGNYIHIKSADWCAPCVNFKKSLKLVSEDLSCLPIATENGIKEVDLVWEDYSDLKKLMSSGEAVDITLPQYSFYKDGKLVKVIKYGDFNKIKEVAKQTY